MQAVAKSLWVCVFVAVLFLFGVIVADKQMLQSRICLIEVIPCACCKGQILTQVGRLANRATDDEIQQLEKYLSQSIGCKTAYSTGIKAIKTKQYGDFVVPNGVYKYVTVSFGQGNGEVYRFALFTAEEGMLLHPAGEKRSFLVGAANGLRFFLLEQLGILDCILFESSAVNSS